jgi:hypothetical protein
MFLTYLRLKSRTASDQTACLWRFISDKNNMIALTNAIFEVYASLNKQGFAIHK